MRILITGSTGFVGKELMPVLLENFPEAKFLCIVRELHSPKVAHLRHPQISLCEGVDEDAIMQFSPSFVIHLAAYSTSREEKGDAECLIESNIRFGVELLYALRKVNSLKLFINTGSFSQYTEKGDAYLYSASKTAFEVFLKYYAREYHFKYITVVPYTIYGGEKTIKRIVDYIVESTYAPTPIDMTPGYQELDFIHIKDVAEFYVAAIKNYSTLLNQQEYHIGSGKSTSIRRVAEVVQEILGAKCNINWGGRSYRPNDIMFAQAISQEDRDRIWLPKYNLESGLREYLEDEGVSKG